MKEFGLGNASLAPPGSTTAHLFVSRELVDDVEVALHCVALFPVRSRIVVVIVVKFIVHQTVRNNHPCQRSQGDKMG